MLVTDLDIPDVLAAYIVTLAKHVCIQDSKNLSFFIIHLLLSVCPNNFKSDKDGRILLIALLF